MSAQLEIALLGPLVVRRAGVDVAVPAGKQRAMLAALLLAGGRVVSIDEMAAALWGSAPPASARVSIQNYVTRLRKALAGPKTSVIRTEPGGYAISTGSIDFDLARFEELLDRARRACADASWDTAALQARAALELWRGEPLAGVESDSLLAREMPRLTEMRLQATQIRIEADMQLGHDAEVVAELRRLVADHPLREGFHCQLMLALYRCGRQGEALAAYQQARNVLVEELGAEPGRELQDLHQRILSADPALMVPGTPQSAAARVVPRQLPSDVAAFTGRTAELLALDRLAGAADGSMTAGGAALTRPVTTMISAVSGTAGVGKTALALHWAHRNADRFPDGQLYVNLRGYDPARPLPASDALAAFLRALGIADHEIPPQVSDRAARFRSLMAGKRMLVVLDNAGSAEQVRPLLPGTATCTVLVTSRDSLAGLVARDGAGRLELDRLPLTDSLTLLRQLIGSRVDADPGAATRLADECARLPLALRVAAELAAVRPAVPLADLASELADVQRRLDLLDAGDDPRTAVRAVFSWSYRHLDTTTARSFRLIGLHVGPDLEPYAAAALTGSPPEQASRQLGVLARAHLMQATAPGRYAMHDLMRGYARELAADQDGRNEERAALTRLLDHYLRTAAAAMDALYPDERQSRPRQPSPPGPLPPVADATAARTWLDTERANLVAAVAHATEHGWPDHAIRLAGIVFRHVDYAGHYPEAVLIHRHACRAAREAGDTTAEAAALNNLGVAWLRTCRYQEAADHFRRALAICRAIRDPRGQAAALTGLGNAEEHQGHYREAINYHRQALLFYQQAGDRSGEAFALGNIGLISRRELHYHQAAGLHSQSLAIFRDLGHRGGEARALNELGAASQGLGRCREATDQRQRALALFREVGDRGGEAEALNGLGFALLADGRPTEARVQHTAALRLAIQIGHRYQEASAHHGLGNCYQAAGVPAQARQHWQQAVVRYAAISSPDADEVRSRLAATANDERVGA